MVSSKEEKRAKSLARIGSIMHRTPFLNNFEFFKRPLRWVAKKKLEDVVRSGNSQLAEYDSSGAEVEIDYDSDVDMRLAQVKRVIREETGMSLYDEQMQAVLAGNYGFSAQVNTGEGKTITTVAYALMKEEQVDVFCSNRKLAERDYREMRDVYQSAGKTVALNIEEGMVMQECDKLGSDVTDLVFENLDNVEAFEKVLKDINERIGYTEELKLHEHGRELAAHIREGINSADLSRYSSENDALNDIVLRAVSQTVYDRVRENKKEAYKADVLYTTVSERIFDFERDHTSSLFLEDQVQVGRQKALEQGRVVAVIDEADQNMIDDATNPKILSSSNQGENAYRKMMMVKVHEEILTPDFYQREGELYNGSILDVFGKSKPIQKKGADYIAEKLVGSDILEEIVGKHGCSLKDGYETMIGKVLYKAIRQKSRTVRKAVRYGLKDSDLAKVFDFSDDESRDRAMNAMEDVSHFINVIHKAHVDHIKAGNGKGDQPDYMVEDGKVILIDRNTKMRQPDRKLQDGLHTGLEIINGVHRGENGLDLEALTNFDFSSASVSNTHFFQKYKDLFWMSGTLEDINFVAEQNYEKPLLVMQPHNPKDKRATWDYVWGHKKDFGKRFQKYTAIANDIIAKHNSGRPVLVRVVNHEEASFFKDLLVEQGVKEEYVNCLTHENEQEYTSVIDSAGKKNMITFVSDMGGRGADIKIDNEVKELGGLYGILTSFSQDKRNDVQAIGRVARNGDPGEVQAYVCSEDEVYGRARGILGHPLLVRVRNYIQQQQNNQQIFKNKNLNIDSIVDELYSQRQELMEQREEVLSLKTFEQIRAYIAANPEKMVNRGLERINLGIFEDKKEFDSYFGAWMGKVFERSLDEKSSLDSDVDEIYHSKKSFFRQKMWDPVFQNAWWVFPAAYTAADAMGSGVSLIKTAYLSALFGIPKGIQYLKDKGFNINRPVGMPESKREPNGAIKMLKFGFENIFYGLAALGMGVAYSHGGTEALMDAFPYALGFYSANRALRWEDKGRVKGMYGQLSRDIFERNLVEEFDKGAEYKRQQNIVKYNAPKKSA